MMMVDNNANMDEEASEQLLKTQTIHYLSPNVLRSFSDIVILSEEGSRFIVNSLVLLSKSHYLKRIFQEESPEELSDVLLITDIPNKDLNVVLESLVRGEMLFPPEDIKGIVAALEALGLQSSHFGPSFSYNNVTLKMEVDETDDIDDEQEEDEDEDFDPTEEEESHEDESAEPQSSWSNLDLPTCTICLESFMEGESYDKHLWSHFTQKHAKILCNPCQKYFLDYQSLKLHVFLIHGGMDLKAPPPPSTGPSSKKSRSKTAKKTVGEAPSLQCVNCGQYNAVDPERFLDIHASSNPYHTPNCNYPECKETFSSYSEHMAHVTSVHEGKFHMKCGRCGDLFTDLPSLMTHKKEIHHHGMDKKNPKRRLEDKAALAKKEKCVCELCGISLSRGNMRTHLKVVHGNDPVDCTVCKKTFNHPMSLKLHSDSAHREFPCSQCGYMCRSPKAYKLHILSKHTLPELKPFQCSVCSKGFTTAYKFKQHENIHRGIKPHVCKFCGKGFCNSSNRNQHEKSIHLGDKRVKTKTAKGADETLA